MPGLPATDHILRTLAAVSPGTSILLAGDLYRTLRPDVSALGFHVDEAASDGELPAGAYAWAVVMLSKTTLPDTVRLLERIRDSVQPGGWVIVSTERLRDSPDWFASGSLPQRGFDSMGFALAERMEAHSDGCHLIVRRVDTGTIV